MLKQIALYHKNNKPTQVLEIKSVNDTQLKSLISTCEENQQKHIEEKEQEKAVLVNRVVALENLTLFLQTQIDELKHEIKVLKGEEE